MLNLQRALKSDRLVRALTGLNRKAFKELKFAFAQVWSNAEVPRRSTPSTIEGSRTKSHVRDGRGETVLHLVLLQGVSHLLRLAQGNYLIIVEGKSDEVMRAEMILLNDRGIKEWSIFDAHKRWNQSFRKTCLNRVC
ncbi:hypothetical protein [Leptothoe sp. PORK10 BA2]|uniref:hypothetical protein n=1 Tax=Leptothoe sp. PORK10 BA2 TaxID=3110254 RepID=UPI002B1EE6A3|nr:hypothetical protein [Leptothoe sp. PORK10 BA2]MEA5467170.1 hypothetical protein [Leptothoe sp. PORK10 BA2]